MLSKLAERLYWMARYIERVENTARLVSVYDHLLFDLPQEVGISWYNLIILNGAEPLFLDRYKNRDERNVVKFLLADDSNPSSLLSSIRALRENVRTSRDLLPQETWEIVNELYIFARDNIKQGINRSRRNQFLEQMVKRCQQINGLLNGTMSRDAASQFLSLGCNLERADMLTRLLDAGAAALLGDLDTDLNIQEVVWGNVLRSSSAHMSYRRTVRSAVRDRDVVAFLLEDPHFPRSFQFCLNQVRDASGNLPNGGEVIRCIEKSLRAPYDLSKSDALGAKFREYLNQLQLELNEVHTCLSESWFPSYERSVI
ncbi:MAG TPA: alpha-E domain-containing protein [Psychromonas sp.]